MLMSLLPGLRQLRAPVAAGAVWLLVLWFSGGEELLDNDHRGALLDSIVKLCDLLGRPISLALLAVCAYLIGMVSKEISQRLDRVIGAMAHRFRVPTMLIPAQHPDRFGEYLLIAYFVDKLSERFSQEKAIQQLLAVEWLKHCTEDHSSEDAPPSRALPKGHPLGQAATSEKVIDIAQAEPLARRTLIEGVVDLEWYARQVIEQRLRLVRNMAVVEPQIYNLIDRFFGEAEFILELILPISALGLIVTLRYSFAGILLILLAIAFVQTAIRPRFEGYGYLYAAIVSGKLDFGELADLTSGPVRLKEVYE
jgi:hypothetical protein